MQPLDVIREIRDLSEESEDWALLRLSTDLEHHVTAWAKRHTEAEAKVNSMCQSVQRLRDALLNTNSILLDRDIESSTCIDELESELTRTFEIARELAPDPPGLPLRHDWVNRPIKDQIREIFGFGLNKVDVLVPQDLPPLKCDLSELNWPPFKILVGALMPSSGEFEMGLDIAVSVAVISEGEHRDLEISIRQRNELKLCRFPQSFAFPLGDTEWVPEGIVSQLIECDCLVRRIGGRFSVTNAPGKGVTITLMFSLDSEG